MNITVTTTEKLEAEQLKKIKSAFAKKYSKTKLNIKEVIDKSLIAGIKITIGSQEYDASVKAKLAQIKNKIYKLI